MRCSPETYDCNCKHVYFSLAKHFQRDNRDSCFSQVQISNPVIEDVSTSGCFSSLSLNALQVGLAPDLSTSPLIVLSGLSFWNVKIDMAFIAMQAPDHQISPQMLNFQLQFKPEALTLTSFNFFFIIFINISRGLNT